MAESKVGVGNEKFYLVELSQMGGVHGLVTEHAVNGEVLLWCELPGFLEFLAKLVKHLCRNRRCVCAQQVLHGLRAFPLVVVTERAETSFLVSALHNLQVVFGHGQSLRRFLDEESIMGIASGMRLWLEE